MASKKKTRLAYRDRLTGKFVKRSVWKDNPGARTGGKKRYVKEKVKIGEPFKPPPPPIGPVQTFFIMFMYVGSSGSREIDFFVRARNDAAAFEFIKTFLAGNLVLWGWALRMLESKMWSEVISRPFDEALDEIEPEEIADLQRRPEGYVEPR